MKGVSKLLNIFGQQQKEKFTDLAMAEVTTEGSLIAVNSAFLAVSWSGVGGCIGVFDSSNPSRISSSAPFVDIVVMFLM